MKEHQKHGFELQFLTDAEYVACGGGQCPHCHKDALHGGSWDSDAHGSTQEVSCLTCGAAWLDVYNLVGYTDIELDNGES